MDTKAAYSIQSLDRVFSIIEFLADHPVGASLTEICREVNLPKATVSRMLASLIRHGYAFQNLDSRKYHLTMRMFEIGSKVVGVTNIIPIARPYLEHLSRISEETVHLVSRVNDEVVYLYKEDAYNSIVRMSSCVGQRAPIYCTGVGKCFLAYLPDDELRAIFQRIELVRFTPTTIVTLTGMRREAAAIRERGYAIDNQEHEAGVRCIAAPILDFYSNPVAAISIAAPVEHMTDADVEKCASILLDAAKSISRDYSGRQ